MFNRTSGTGVLGMAAVVAITGGSAHAGLLSANSAGAMPGFTGSTNFSGGMSTFTVNADVDYAVFAPGDFGAAFPGLDPSGGTEYVYAYQIHNLDTNVLRLTVGLDGDEPLGTISSIPDVGLVDPSDALFVGLPAPATSAAWDFSAPNSIPIGTSSAVLFFTSAAGPEYDSATVEAAFPASQPLPSPLPEPASLGLMAMGLALMGSRQLTRK